MDGAGSTLIERLAQNSTSPASSVRLMCRRDPGTEPEKRYERPGGPRQATPLKHGLGPPPFARTERSPIEGMRHA